MMVSETFREKLSLVTGVLVFFLSIGISQSAWPQDPGAQVFNSTCFACHTIGGGRLVGPDLSGVHDRRTQEWLESFVQSSKSMVDSGDATAVALFEEFNRMPMPDAVVSAEQIRQVLSYIKSKSSAQEDSTGIADTDSETPPEPTEAAASEEDIQIGQNLFQGSLRFSNGGPACNSCHDVRHDAVIGGGILARELTTVFSRMGGAGVTAIIGQAPFPVMQAAYKNHSLTEDEVAALVAFLEYADSEQYNQLPRDYGIGLFLVGCVGAAILFLLFGFIWRGRKKGSVNQAIYDRQIQSVSDKQN